jgi:hypothetical protein
MYASIFHASVESVELVEVLAAPSYVVGRLCRQSRVNSDPLEFDIFTQLL